MTTDVVSANEVAYARDLTDRIKRGTVLLWSLVEEAHSKEVWKSLGHPSWKAYVAAEFNMSEQRSYQLLDQARVTKALRAAAKDSTGVESDYVPTEAAARDIKPLIGEVVEDVRAGTPVQEAIAKVREPVRSVARERVVFSDEDADEGDPDYRCPRCGFKWDGMAR